MRESLSTLADLLTRSEFRTGIVVGAIALVVLAVLPRSDRFVRPWALTTAIAVLIGVQIVDGRRLGLAGGIAVLAIGGWVVGQGARPDGGRPPVWPMFGWPLVVLGAMIIPWRGQVDESDWFFVATPVVIVATGALLARWPSSAPETWLGPLSAITAFAVWTTVPDTELARLQLGVALPLAAATLRPVSAGMTSAGAFALAGVIAYIPALGGEDRPASIIGAWASIGVLALIPFARTIWPHREHLGIVATFVLHSALVLVAARVIGLWVWAVPAAAAAFALYAAALALIHGLTRPKQPAITSGARPTGR